MEMNKRPDSELKFWNLECQETTFFKISGEGRILEIGFMLQRKVKEQVIAFNPISNRLCSIRLKGHTRNISVLNLPSPIQDAEG